jgi:hypothetical protein
LPQLPYETAIYLPPVPNAVVVGNAPVPTFEEEYFDADAGEMGDGETFDEVRRNETQTELEQSVSATLLKLAGAPSKLFSGISSLFDRSETIGETTESGSTDAALKETNSIASTATSAQQAKPSLLDDFEESPMEARLRTVRWS